MLRLGVIGVRHPHVAYLFDAVARRPDLVSLVALAEDDPRLRAEYAARFGPAPRLYSDYRELLAAERLDVAGIAATNDARAVIVRDCLAAGLHVVADKPLCTTLEDLGAIEGAWRASGRQLSVMLEKRCWGPTLALRDLVASGELGDLALAWASGPHRLRRAGRPDWMFRRASYGGILNDLAIHDLDLLLWLIGARAGRVQGLTGNLRHRDLPEFEDHGQVLLRAGVLMATVEVHWLSPEAAPYHGDYRLVLTGTHGTAEARWAFDKLTVATDREPPREVPLPPARSVVEDFFTALIAGDAPAIDAEEIFLATRVALLAQAGANDGRWHDWRF